MYKIKHVYFELITAQQQTLRMYLYASKHTNKYAYR